MHSLHMMALWNMEMKSGDCFEEVIQKGNIDVNDVPGAWIWGAMMHKIAVLPGKLGKRLMSDWNRQ